MNFVAFVTKPPQDDGCIQPPGISKHTTGHSTLPFNVACCRTKRSHIKTSQIIFDNRLDHLVHVTILNGRSGRGKSQQLNVLPLKQLPPQTAVKRNETNDLMFWDETRAIRDVLYEVYKEKGVVFGNCGQGTNHGTHRTHGNNAVNQRIITGVP